mgnify:CR=1 FL=1|jgi:hypothetical protein
MGSLEDMRQDLEITGVLDMNNNKIINLGAATLDSDASRKDTPAVLG